MGILQYGQSRGYLFSNKPSGRLIMCNLPSSESFKLSLNAFVRLSRMKDVSVLRRGKSESLPSIPMLV